MVVEVAWYQHSTFHRERGENHLFNPRLGLNKKAEVIGVNSLKLVAVNLEGLNFAIFASEILQMLKEHFNYTPQYSTPTSTNSTLSAVPEKGGIPASKAAVQVDSEPSGAEIFVDGSYVGSAPSKLILSVGDHAIKITRLGYLDWERKITVEPESAKTVNAILEKKQNVTPTTQPTAKAPKP